MLDTSDTPLSSPNFCCPLKVASNIKGPTIAHFDCSHNSCRKEAIHAGAVPALCSVLGTGDDEPVSIEVLKALYTIIAPDASGKGSISTLITESGSCRWQFADMGKHWTCKTEKNVDHFHTVQSQ